MTGNYVKKRRELNQATRTGGLEFSETYLPTGRMPREQVKQLQDLMQRARELRPAGTQLVIPTATGQMLTASAYKLEQDAPKYKQQALTDFARFQQILDNEPKEWVENWSDSRYVGMLNGQAYVVPRGKKKLPRTLAEHYREKNGLTVKGRDYEQRMGELRDGEGPEMTTEQFSKAVNSYDTIETEDATRRIIY